MNHPDKWKRNLDVNLPGNKTDLDFSLSIYESLLDHFKEADYAFQTFSQYLEAPASRVVLLRHDVDDRKRHSLEFAGIQHRKGIVGAYYFRMVPQSFDEGIIREIYSMGHEIGYHYEDMHFARGNPQQAIRLFKSHLEKLRKIVPVTSICMHGSPRSKYDNRDLWKYYDYRDYGIIGEPYFDLDFKNICYLTDTGRRWDGRRVSVRDKVPNHFEQSFHSTHDIIDCLRQNAFPKRAMLNFHPQRWTDRYPLWLKEKYYQRLKNGVKYWLIRYSRVKTPNK